MKRKLEMDVEKLEMNIEYWKRRKQYYEDKFKELRQDIQVVIDDALKEVKND